MIINVENLEMLWPGKSHALHSPLINSKLLGHEKCNALASFVLPTTKHYLTRAMYTETPMYGWYHPGPRGQTTFKVSSCLEKSKDAVIFLVPSFYYVRKVVSVDHRHNDGNH